MYGMTLPYGQGGLVPNNCMSCMSENYNNYQLEVSQMCRRPYEGAGYRCEGRMESYNWYFGQNNQGCSYLESAVKGDSSFSQSNTDQSLFTQRQSSTFSKLRNNKTAQFAGLFVLSAFISASAITICILAKQRSRRVKRLQTKSMTSPDETNDGILTGEVESGTSDSILPTFAEIRDLIRSGDLNPFKNSEDKESKNVCSSFTGMVGSSLKAIGRTIHSVGQKLVCTSREECEYDEMDDVVSVSDGSYEPPGKDRLEIPSVDTHY